MMRIHKAAEKWGISERRITALCRAGKIIGAEKNGKFWLIPESARIPGDGRRKNISVVENEQTTTGFTTTGAYENVWKVFRQTYEREPKNIAFTPYRICPVGAHCDHNLGKITGLAIDKGIYIAYGPKRNGIVEIKSLQFPKRAQWHVAAVPAEKENDWADHLRGVTAALGKRFPLRVGFCAVIDGELPIGGLSSSAAVILTFLYALAELNDIRLSKADFIEIAKEAENGYVGVSCGKLDQACEMYCRRDHLLYMDVRDDTFELIPTPPNAKPYEIAVFFSGLERSLTESIYNMRVDEARAAAYSLKALAGLPYGKFSETTLRDVPYAIYLQYKDRLPLPWAKRAAHWYGEMKRTEEAAAAWRRGDTEAFGRLTFESGRSSIENWETGSPELIRLYEIMTKTDGIYGGRFSGAGFKGCCIAFIDPKKERAILEKVESEYLRAFPHLRGKYSAHICHSADGVKL